MKTPEEILKLVIWQKFNTKLENWEQASRSMERGVKKLLLKVRDKRNGDKYGHWLAMLLTKIQY